MKKILLLILAISLNVLATQVIRYINAPAGAGSKNGSTWGNAYSSLSAWENVENKTSMATDTQTVYFRGSDTLPFVGSGWAAGAVMRIVVPDSLQAHGLWNENKALLRVKNAHCIDIRANQWDIIGLQIHTICPTAWHYTEGIRYASGTFGPGTVSNISNCIIRGHDSTANTMYQNGINSNVPNLHINVWNCIIYDFVSTYSTRGINCAYGGGTIYNTTVIGPPQYGIIGAKVKNCYVQSAGTCYVASPAMITCASSDATGSTGLLNIQANSTIFTDVSAGSEDFRLPAGSALCNKGTDNYGEVSPFNFTTDICGSTRNSPWDIGACEGTGTPPVTPPTNSPRICAAKSASYADVKTAYDSCRDGQVLIIPTGLATWTNQTLTVDKAIDIRGAGALVNRGCAATAPIITNNNPLVSCAHAPIFNVQPSSNKRIRISNINFRNTLHDSYWPHVTVTGSLTGSYALTRIRVDHCTFNFGGRQLNIVGCTYGVGDHNLHINGDVAVSFTGDDNYAWKRVIAAGTANAWFNENDSFVTNSSYGSDHLDELIYHQQGSRTVTRYNKFNCVNYTSGAGLFFDVHGNQPQTYMFRGVPIGEIYNNQFSAYTTYQYAAIRGGSWLVHDNKYTYVTSAANPFALWEEESWTGGGPWCPNCPYSRRWPAMDQINNSFFWNNTLQGSVISDITLSCSQEIPYIVKNRDYFMHAPQASGGYESWPDSAGSMNMTFKAGANAYYPYTPFVYPHPLTHSVNYKDSANSITATSFKIIDTCYQDTGRIYLQTSTNGTLWTTVDSSLGRGPGSKDTCVITGLFASTTYHVRLLFKGIGYSDGTFDTTAKWTDVTSLK